MTGRFPRLTLEMLLCGNVPEEYIPLLSAVHDTWQSHLFTKILLCGGRLYALVWLDEVVEGEIDDAWGKTPYIGYLYHCLAQALCMEAMHSLLEVKTGHCLPFPVMTTELRREVARAGCPLTEDGLLARRYASLTLADCPPACSGCAFNKDCTGWRGDLPGDSTWGLGKEGVA